jgi:hypothetical protein
MYSNDRIMPGSVSTPAGRGSHRTAPQNPDRVYERYTIEDVHQRHRAPHPDHLRNRSYGRECAPNATITPTVPGDSTV